MVPLQTLMNPDGTPVPFYNDLGLIKSKVNQAQEEVTHYQRRVVTSQQILCDKGG